jgi:protein MpaA
LQCAAPSAPEAAAAQLIGRSVQGRPIVAAVRGPRLEEDRLLVVGSIHGDEPAGVRVIQRLAAAAPPRGVSIWLVPSLNPDGLARGTRGNARGVDLNRNFGWRWRPLGGLEYSGRRPFSEPESRAARRLIRRLNPDVTIWFHQPFGLVDRSGASVALERRYAELVGLPLVQLRRRYPGSATNWQNARTQGDAFVVELPAAVGTGLVSRAARAVRTLGREFARGGLGKRRVARRGR